MKIPYATAAPSSAVIVYVMNATEFVMVMAIASLKSEGLAPQLTGCRIIIAI